MGTYKGGADHYHSISENISRVTETYPLHDGLFGDRGHGGSRTIRNIASNDPAATAKDFYDKIAHGGIEKDLFKKDGSPNGKETKMADGSIINWRPVSSSDQSPAVDIFVSTKGANGRIVTQKIHFIKG
ncbi:MAG: hypothetical protein IJI45_00345 [Anaerolineaceae bacterium]|nr:hypothetical protein [Anaerolineaceae bacterium]